MPIINQQNHTELEENLPTLATGQDELCKLISSLSDQSNMNEAQTRFHIIDVVLINCLGWCKDEIEVEKVERRKFTDYEIGKPRTLCVNEGETPTP